MNHHPLKNMLAEHFQGEIATLENNFMTMPQLLRAIADWMEDNEIKDSRYVSLIACTEFDEEDSYETVTLLYQ